MGHLEASKADLEDEALASGVEHGRAAVGPSLADCEAEGAVLASVGVQVGPRSLCRVEGCQWKRAHGVHMAQPR